MTLTAETPVTERLWGHFDDVRDRLLHQWREAEWDDDTGAGVEVLEREIDGWVDAHPDQAPILLKAHAFRIVTTRGRLAIDPEDWFADKLDHGDLVRKLRNRWMARAREGELRETARWTGRMFELGVVRCGLDVAHVCPGWEKMLRHGLGGLIEMAEATRRRLGKAATAEQLAFLEAVVITHRAIIELARRFAHLARRAARSQTWCAQRLLTIAEAFQRVPERPPQTFHQALQFVWLMHEMVELEGEPVRSMGGFDRLLNPYLLADLESGRLTRDQAKELLKFFWWKFTSRHQGGSIGSRNKNFLLGGQDAGGEDVTCELTWLALETMEELSVPDPKFAVRIHPGTPPALLRRLLDLQRRGRHFMLMNDEPVIAAMLKKGKSLEDARQYVPIGCYEPAVGGKEISCSMMIVTNLAKPVELALHDGVDPLSGEQVGPRTGDPRQFTDFQQFFAAYAAQLNHIIDTAADCAMQFESRRSQLNPSPVLAAALDDCLERVADLGEGGVRYHTTGCTGVALANAADSLLAVKRAVFEDRHCTMEELVAAIDADFAGREDLRLYLVHRVPKWGNDDPEADAMTRQVAEHYCQKIHSFRNVYGSFFQAALFSFTLNYRFGRNTGALPDGRGARQPLATGAGAMAGRDVAGVTALMNSALKVDWTETPNGTVLDVMLHPASLRGESGLNALDSLTRNYFQRGGYALQYNVVDVDTLRAAQREPERYQSLQIRVTGYSAYFTRLPRCQQDHFISQRAHAL